MLSAKARKAANAASADALRGLIEGKLRLGPWKQRLLDDPTLVMPAYLAAAHRLA